MSADCRKDTWVKGERCRKYTPDPLGISGMLKWELRQHFQPNRIWLPGLKDCIWRPNPDNPEEMDPYKTGLTVEVAEIPRREATGNLPSLFVKRGDIQTQRQGLLGSQQLGINLPTGGVSNSQLFQGSWTVIATSEKFGLVERIAWETFLFFTHFERVLEHEYRLNRCRATNYSEPAVGESEGVEYFVVIQLEIAFNSGWEVAAQAPRLKNIHSVLEDGA